MRIVHCISHATQYNAPLYRLIYQRYPKSFEVWYERSPMIPAFDPGFGKVIDWGEAHLSCGYEWEVVDTRLLADAFRRRKPDVVWMHGYATPRNLYLIWLAKRHGCKVWMRGETHLRLPASSLKKALRRLLLPWLFRQVDVCLYIGTQNRLFYEHYGVPKEKLVCMPYCVDNEWWMTGKEVEREQFVLYVGKLLPEKGLDRLLRVADALPEVQFVVAGDGPVAIDRPNITNLGFQTPAQLRDLYRRAACLLVPSRSEPWGLVVNEALCCGCPVLTTAAVASAIDLHWGVWIHHWIHMQSMPLPGSPDAQYYTQHPVGDPSDHHMTGLAVTLRQMVHHEWDHAQIRAQMARWSYEQDLQGMEEALKR